MATFRLRPPRRCLMSNTRSTLRLHPQHSGSSHKSSVSSTRHPCRCLHLHHRSWVSSHARTARTHFCLLSSLCFHESHKSRVHQTCMLGVAAGLWTTIDGVLSNDPAPPPLST
eukprot:scaffold51829_cov32-Tisochrysis_lutea.AAC.1